MEGKTGLQLKWTAEEEEALLAGVAKHGAGNWKAIMADSKFGSKLIHCSNMRIRDTLWSWMRGRPFVVSRIKVEEALKKSESLVSEVNDDETVEMVESFSETKDDDEDGVPVTKKRRTSETAGDIDMVKLQSMFRLAKELCDRFT